MYLDTSVLVKLLIPEPDTKIWLAKVTGHPVTTSAIAVTEVFSALMACERAGKIKGEQRLASWAQFQDWITDDTIRLVETDQGCFRQATRMIAICHPDIPLRSLDAIHLACADKVQDWPLASNDTRMLAAATRLAMPVV